MFDGSSQSLPSVAFWTAWAHSGRSRKRPGVPFYYVRRVLAVITVGGVLDRVGAQREEQEAARRGVLLCSMGPRSHYRRWRSGPRRRTAGGAGSGASSSTECVATPRARARLVDRFASSTPTNSGRRLRCALC